MQMKQRGLSFIELLISLFLTSLIMLALSQLYLISKGQYRAAQALLESGLELQWLKALFEDSIRRAGFTPCLGIQDLDFFDEQGHKAKALALQLWSEPEVGFQINRMSEDFVQIDSILSPTELLTAQKPILNEQHPVLISACTQAELHRIQRIHRYQGQWLIRLSRPIHFLKQDKLYLGQWLEEKWFMAHHKNRPASLYYQSTHKEELSVLVHSLKVELQKIQGKQQITLTLGLDSGQKQTLISLVRGS